MLDSEPKLTRLVPIASIKIVEEAMREVKEKSVESLAETIERDGLLHPIGVWRIPDETEKYELVFGQHRLLAAVRLEREVIEAKILTCSYDEMLRIRKSENLFHHPLKAAAYKLALYEWYLDYKEKHPETAQGRAGGIASSKARKKKAREAATTEDSADFEPDADALRDDPTDAKPEPPEPAYKYIARMTGRDERNVLHDIRDVKVLGPEKLLALKKSDLCSVDIHKLATIQDKDQRQRAVTHVLHDRLPVDDAIEKATMPLTQDGNPLGDPEALGTLDKDLSDEDWVGRYCSAALARLSSKEAQEVYLRDAAIYRKTNARLLRITSALRKVLSSMNQPGANGPWYRTLSDVSHVLHPDQWMPCERCSGSGLADRTLPNGQPCGKCHGAGYAIETET